MCLLCCCCMAFNNFSSMCIDITLLVLNTLATVITFLTLIIVKWKNVSGFSLFIVVLIFLIDVALTVMSCLIVCWRKGGSIKDATKAHAYRMATAGLVLAVTVFVCCVIADIALGVDFAKANYPCSYYNYDSYHTYDRNRRLVVNKNDIDCSLYFSKQDIYFEVVTTGEILMSYLCVSYTEIAMIFAMILWVSSKRRITDNIFGAIMAAQPAYVVDPYAVGGGVMQPQVIVVQGNQYGQQGQGMYPQYQYAQGYGTAGYVVGAQPQQNYQVQQNQQPQNVQNITNMQQYEKPGAGFSSGRNIQG